MTLAVPVALSLMTQSINIPRNDDWAFSRSAFTLFSTGEIRLRGWGSMTLIGHLVWALPFLALFGQALWVLQLANAVALAIGLFALHSLARRFLPRRRALLPVALIACFPGVAMSATTYMTDTTAFAAEMSCLAVAAAALNHTGRRRLLLLGAATIIGGFGFSVREFAVIAPLSALVTALVVCRRPTERAVIAGLTTAFVAGCCAFYWWRHNLPGGNPLPIGLPTSRAFLSVTRGYFTASLGLLPAAILAAAVGWSRTVACGVATVGLAVLAFGKTEILPAIDKVSYISGNIINRQGALGDHVLAGVRPPVPDDLWYLVEGMAAIAGLLILGLLVGVIPRMARDRRTWRSAPLLLPACFLILKTVLLIAFLAPGSSIFDRYLWPVVACAAILVLRPMHRTARSRHIFSGLSGTAWLTLGLVSLAITANSSAFDGARWSAGKDIVADGVPADRIDAGFEWVGYHASRLASPRDEGRLPFPQKFYASIFGPIDYCVIVSASRVDSESLVLTDNYEYKTFALFGRQPLFRYDIRSDQDHDCKK